MRRRKQKVCLPVLLSVFFCTAPAIGATPEEVRAAIEKSLPLLEVTAAGTTSHRKCFTCHGHALPVFAILEAEKRGFPIDRENLEAQLDHTASDIEAGQPVYSVGRGMGGGFTRAGYALWTLAEGGRESDEFTRTAVDYLLHKSEIGFWRSNAKRPPSEGSPFATTYVALKGLQAFAQDDQLEKAGKRKELVLSWVKKTEARDTEDRVFRLLGLHELNAGDDLVSNAAENLLQTQSENGGWAQNSELQPDAYATGSALYALYQTQQLKPAEAAYRNGIKYLLKTQKPDGSWHVVTRADPVQKYYESGYPHGEDQFISMAAGGWATLALLYSLGK